MKIIKYEEIKLLKQSEKSTVLLVREAAGEQFYVKKHLKGQHPVYTQLQNCVHPYLPKLYEVAVEDDTTTIIEEYIEGQPLESVHLSEKQIVNAVKELCSVLEFLHGKDMIHRDIKPSNIIFATDGHIRLIDFDAARIPKEDSEQDTKLIGTRGYAPPEQYGFAQTDARTDIYALGITLGQLLGELAHKPLYRRIIGKCTNLNPDERYQSVRQVKQAFSLKERRVLYSIVGIVLIAAFCYAIPSAMPAQEETLPVSEPVGATVSEPVNATVSEPVPATPTLTVLPAPENPRWDGETGVALWGNVPDSGKDGEVAYLWKLYRQDTRTPPDPDETEYFESGMRGNGGRDKNFPTYDTNIGHAFWENGFYYFAVSAVGDGVNFADSPYVMSDAFEYTGEFAPPLPAPTGLAWEYVEAPNGRQHYAVWSNLDDYADKDTFNVEIYNKAGEQISRNKWTKDFIDSIGKDGVWFDSNVFADQNESYRFTVQVETSRPNEYRSSTLPDPVPEEYFSPWYRPSDDQN